MQRVRKRPVIQLFDFKLRNDEVLNYNYGNRC